MGFRPARCDRVVLRGKQSGSPRASSRYVDTPCVNYYQAFPPPSEKPYPEFPLAGSPS